MIYRIAHLLSLMGLLTLAAVAQAQQKAATSQLPPALRAIGVTEHEVVTGQEAHQIRGAYYRFDMSGYGHMMAAYGYGSWPWMNDLYGGYGYMHSAPWGMGVGGASGWGNMGYHAGPSGPMSGGGYGYRGMMYQPGTMAGHFPRTMSWGGYGRY